MQECSNSLMVEVCRQEYVSLEKAFLQLFYHSGLFYKNLDNMIFCVSRKQHIKISGVRVKRSKIFSSDFTQNFKGV